MSIARVTTVTVYEGAQTGIGAALGSHPSSTTDVQFQDAVSFHWLEIVAWDPHASEAPSLASNIAKPTKLIYVYNFT
jgi:hypothetical protein